MRLGTAIEHLVEAYKYASDKEWIQDKVAWALYHTWKDADRKTEPSSSEIPNNWEGFFREPTAEERKAVADYIDSISVPTGVNVFDLMGEPQTDCGDFADRLAYERGVKHAWEVAQKVFNSTLTFYEAEDLAKQIDKDINVRSKDEPQTEYDKYREKIKAHDPHKDWYTERSE